jgi:DNA-binding response OmpR family regulator
MARILIIDDEEAIRLSLQVTLEREGHEVVCASDGEQGLRVFASKTRTWSSRTS